MPQEPAPAIERETKIAIVPASNGDGCVPQPVEPRLDPDTVVRFVTSFGDTKLSFTDRDPFTDGAYHYHIRQGHGGSSFRVRKDAVGEYPYALSCMRGKPRAVPKIIVRSR